MKRFSEKKQNLNKALSIFFAEALKVARENPIQVVSFLRTLRWLAKASRIRSQWKNKGINVPPIIIYSITNKCNLHCKGCYNQAFFDETPFELSEKRLWSLFEEAKDLGVSFFVIAGGEPFLRPELLEITRMYPEIIFLVFTNGLLINDKILAQLKTQKNVIPILSLEGYKEETDLRRGEGTFKTVLEKMKALKKNKVFFGTSLTLTCSNFSLLTSEKFTREIYTFGCKFFLYLEYTAVMEGTDYWILDAAQRSVMRQILEKYRKQFSSLFIAVPWDEDDVGGCLSAGRGFVHINAQGDVEPCPFAPFSETNVRENSLKDALQSEFFHKIRQIPELSRETGGGCVLWKEKETVKGLLRECKQVPIMEQEVGVC